MTTLPSSTRFSSFRRLVASLMALGFVGAGLAEAADRNECVHHGWGSHDSAESSSHAGSSHADTGSGDAQNHACTCVGDCGASVPLVTSGPAGAVLPAPSHASPASPAVDRIPVWQAHILPFATAPPTTA